MDPRERALTEEQEKSVIASLRAGISAGRLVASLQQSDLVGGIARNIYNIKANERRILLGERSPVTNLL